MDVDLVPEHLVIIGGSYIGLEFAQMYRRFGAQVTVVEKIGEAPAARGRRRRRRRSARSSSAKAWRSAPARNAWRSRRSGGRIVVGLECQGGEPRRRRAATCCSRSGRAPNTHDLGLTEAGIDTDARGYINVDDAVPHQRRRRLGDGRRERPRRLHPHLVERLRDRRREPVRQRSAQDLRPHPVLRALHRPAARPRRHERGRSAQERPQASSPARCR